MTNPDSKHAEKKAALFARTAGRVRVITFEELPEAGDVSDWFGHHGGTVEALWERVEQAPTWAPSGGEDADDDFGEKEAADDTLYSLGDFTAFLPTHTYLFKPTRDLWPAASVNSCASLRSQ